VIGADDLAAASIRRSARSPWGKLLATWVVHDLNHTGQIVKTMAKAYADADAVGPWREFLPIVDAP
jgi:hypothetical protein